MTLQKVAKHAGVSVSTASKALSNGKDISDETKELVRRAAAELGYFSEQKKRKMDNRSGTCPTVALICPEIISIHYSEYVTCLCRLIEQRGGKASVFITGFDKDKLNSVIERCIAENEISAAVCLEVPHYKKTLPFPVVYLANIPGENSVYPNITAAILSAVSYMHDMGHKKIGYVGEILTKQKETAFCESMETVCGKYNPDHIFCEEGRFEIIGNNAAEKIINMPAENRPTALLAAYDEVAYGLMHTLRSAGIKVPEDISVMGINDIPMSKFLDTPLTTIRIPTEKASECAVDIIMNELSGKTCKKQTVILECEIIKRASVIDISEEKQ